jgi:uncharacterized repeat protein (TIGR03847 family)
VSASFEMPEPDLFTTGTVGEPGQRIFYLQGRSGTQVVTLRLEKAQVAALAEYLAELLSDLPTPAPSEIPDDVELLEPVVAEWIVGQIGVVFDETRDRMLIRADEVATVDEEGEPLADAPDGGVARFALTRGQVAAFVVRAATLVASGRPPCPLCGRPLDPEGHMCIKTNGHRKH